MAAVDDLYAAVDALLNPRLVKVHDQLSTTVPSRLDQLEQAIEPSSGVTGTGSVYRAPAHLDVMALLAEIDLVTSAALRQSGYRGRLDQTRSWRIRAWTAYGPRWSVGAPYYLEAAIEDARKWVQRADGILTPDPQTIETRAQPCPSCANRTAMIWDPTMGERVQRSALYLDKSQMTVYCRRCPAAWGASLWPLLCKILEGSSSKPEGPQ
jgi:hypothetical protein